MELEPERPLIAEYRILLPGYEPKIRGSTNFLVEII